MDAQVFATLRQIALETDEARRAELREESNAVLSAHFARHSQDMEELAYDLLNLAWSDAGGTELVRQIIDVKTIGLAMPDYIEEDLRGGRAYWQGKGGQILSDIIRYERLQMPREEMVTAWDFHRDEVETDFWGSFDKLKAQANAKLDQLPVLRLIELIQASITAGAYFGSFAGATLTDDQVDSVVEQVALRSGGNVTIMGTRVAVRNLASVGIVFGQNVAEKIFTTGVIGTYKGYNVVTTENFEDFTGNFVLPNNELWIVGKNAGRLTYYGNTAKVQQLQLPSFWLRWETARDAGMLLHGASRGRIGRIVLT